VYFVVLSAKTEKIFESRFGTLTPELDKLRETLIMYGCGNVAMESTSIPNTGIRYLKYLRIRKVNSIEIALAVETCVFTKILQPFFCRNPFLQLAKSPKMPAVREIFFNDKTVFIIYISGS
jgi:hypothetical protein